MKEVSAESKWEITTKRYVAFIDIMGFKDMLLRATHNEIYEMMKEIDKKIKSNADIPWGKTKEKLVKATTYSDSIMIYSKDDSSNSLHSFRCTVAGLTSDLLRLAIPHKGAVAFGMMTLDTDNSIYFGQPLIDAYLLQEELYFYGVVAHATFEQELSIKEMGNALIANYLCPFKMGKSYHLTITPIFLMTTTTTKHKLQRDELINSCNKFRLKTSGHLRNYIENTELYLNTLKKEII